MQTCFSQRRNTSCLSRSAEDHYLVGLAHEQFTERLAYHWGEVSVLHPFRDGNTRSQSVFFDLLRKLRLHAIAGSHMPLAAFLCQLSRLL
ncbi:Fic family protein [Brevibacterium ravenspurgense]|uniref:Fic family protein n=1 Tax=Brevibacterium ravenspurgense TaxID=479117 RepID=UPI001EF350E4|nr:Fic family protein [Brevibacterium ravenspurgense]MCG7301634.1 Fic family protein [Brevibacterium ravenspurgense]